MGVGICSYLANILSGKYKLVRLKSLLSDAETVVLGSGRPDQDKLPEIIA